MLEFTLIALIYLVGYLLIGFIWAVMVAWLDVSKSAPDSFLGLSVVAWPITFIVGVIGMVVFFCMDVFPPALRRLGQWIRSCVPTNITEEVK